MAGSRGRLLGAVSLGISIAVAGAGAVAVLHDRDVRPAWVERLYGAWFMSADELSDAAFQLRLSGDTAGALKLFGKALRRDQASAYRWCDYAEALLASGDEGRARKCMERAVELGPYVGPVRMRAVNFAYRTGDAGWALAQGLKLVGMTEAYDAVVFAVWDRMEVGPSAVLKAGLPDRRSAQAYVRQLMGAKRLRDADAAWRWAERRGFSDDRLADQYAAFLAQSGECEEAARAWAAHTRVIEPGYLRDTVVFNGGFEREPIGSFFDWLVYEVEGARVRRDSGTSAEGRWSLRLDFDGTRNLAYQAVSQRAVLGPGRWIFEARVRTRDVTTDEGVGFRIYEADAPQRLLADTERLTGTHGWAPLTAEFVVTAPARLVVIQIVRSPSLRFDNLFGGTVWVDGVRVGLEGR